MKPLLIGFAVLLALACLVFGEEPATDDSVQQSFEDNGSVRLMLSSGDYTVRPGASDHIVVRWQPESSATFEDMKRIKVRFGVSGNVASIRTDGPTKHARITIEVPPHSNLYLRMRAGDVRIAGVEGNKDVHMTAGDLTIDVRPDLYSLVHASVTFGDLRAGPMGISRDGIGNSLDWTGTGKYRLNASLFAGDLVLSSQRKRD